LLVLLPGAWFMGVMLRPGGDAAVCPILGYRFAGGDVCVFRLGLQTEGRLG
jgi:hypothetical protein